VTAQVCARVHRASARGLDDEQLERTIAANEREATVVCEQAGGRRARAGRELVVGRLRAGVEQPRTFDPQRRPPLDRDASADVGM
jgi:hypothetical protein